MDVFLDGMFGLLASAWPPVRRAGRRWRDPHAWAEADPSPLTWLAAFGLLLPVLPVAVGTVHFGSVAWKLADDDLMWFLGLVLFLPLAVFAVVATCLLASWALTSAFWLLTGRDHADLLAAGYLVVMGLLAWPLFGMGLAAYGWAMLCTSMSAVMLLAAYVTARH